MIVIIIDTAFLVSLLFKRLMDAVGFEPTKPEGGGFTDRLL